MSAGRSSEPGVGQSLEKHLSLSGGDREDLQQLLRGEVRPVAARTVLLRQDARHDEAYFVKSGWFIESKLLRDGRRQIESFRLPGELFGLDGLAYQKALFSVTSLNAAEVIAIPLKRFEALEKRCPRLTTVILIRSLRNEAMLREWEVNLGRRRGRERLAHLLLELHRRLALLGLTDDGTMSFPVTQEELADCLGLTTVYVNRLLARLRRDGIVEMRDRTLTITRLEELRREAGFEERYLQHTAADGF